MRKNIHVIVKYFHPVAAGIETNVLETYSVLAKKGWNVTIHTSSDTLTEKNVLPSSDQLRGLTIKRYPFKWYGYFPKINTSEADFICLHNFNIVPHLYVLLLTLIRKLVGKKTYCLVLTPHGGFNPEWSIFPKISGLLKKYYHLTIGAFLINKTVDIVRAVSLWEKNAMIATNLSPKLISVITNGIEDEAYEDVDKKASLKIKKDVALYGTYILQIGRVYMIKNYETTIKAMLRIPEEVKYVIAGPVGSEEYKEKLLKLIKELGLEKRVIFAGVIRGVDKYYLIKHAQMMVHMAIYESFCNVVHEGMSQGLVCIVANNTALPLLIKDNKNGFCVDTYADKKVARKINYVLQNKNSAAVKEMEDTNRSFGLAHSWTGVAQKVESLYVETQDKISNSKIIKNKEAFI